MSVKRILVGKTNLSQEEKDTALMKASERPFQVPFVGPQAPVKGGGDTEINQ